jgi:hypothetical protein
MRGRRDMIKSAEISKCGKYRYSLTRVWSDNIKTFIWVMLNPSTADAETDDPTIRKCIGFSKKYGCGGMYIINLFAYRATSPKQLLLVDDPYGSENDYYLNLSSIKIDYGIIIYAYGNIPKGLMVPAHIFGKKYTNNYPIKCLGKTKLGFPKHPLYLSYNTNIQDCFDEEKS